MRFTTDYVANPEPDVFTLIKSPALIEKYRGLVAGLTAPRIVELGIAHGGSTALLALLTRPAKLVSIELATEPLPLLERFITERGLGDSVRPHLGIDQGDRLRLSQLVHDEFHGELVDLVIDDASHVYEPTLRSFECLLPRLRPGGTYLIEDWAWHHAFARQIKAVLADATAAEHQAVADALVQNLSSPREVPLSRLACELMLLLAEGGGIVDQVAVDEDWIAVRRGDAALDDSFRLGDVLEDSFATLSSTDGKGPHA